MGRARLARGAGARPVSGVQPPRRAHEIILQAGADTAERLAAELRLFADRVERGEITTGAIGGPDAGTMYSYVHRPEMTHERFFRDLNAWLAAKGYGRD